MAATLRNIRSMINSRHYKVTHGLSPDPQKSSRPKNWDLARKAIDNYLPFSEDEEEKPKPDD